jgi:hypothetical protein
LVMPPLLIVASENGNCDRQVSKEAAVSPSATNAIKQARAETGATLFSISPGLSKELLKRGVIPGRFLW